MEPVRNVSSNPQEGFTFHFDWSGNSKSISKDTSLQFKPPCLTSCALLSAWQDTNSCFPAGRHLFSSNQVCLRPAACRSLATLGIRLLSELVQSHATLLTLLAAQRSRQMCCTADAVLLRCSFATGKGSGVVLWIYAVPTSATTTRIVINSVLIQDKAGKGTKLESETKLDLAKSLSKLGITTAFKYLPRCGPSAVH